MGLSATVIWITITTFNVTGSNVERIEFSKPTSYESTSECYNETKRDRDRYYKDYKKKRDRFAYSYKEIRCKKRDLGDFSKILKRF